MLKWVNKAFQSEELGKIQGLDKRAILAESEASVSSA